MKSKLLEDLPEKTYVIVFDPGEQVPAGLLDFVKKHKITGARFSAIGAFSEVTLGYFDLEKKEYLKNPIREQVEVVSLLGNVAMHKDEPKLHAHIVVGKRDGHAFGGHLLDGRVQPTLEVMLVESPKAVCRTIDERTGLPLINLD